MDEANVESSCCTAVSSAVRNMTGLTRPAGTDTAECNQKPRISGDEMPANVLWIIAVVIAIIGVIVLISGSVLWGIILLVLAALVGPGGYSIFNRRV
jgi:hypothetical protein